MRSLVATGIVSLALASAACGAAPPSLDPVSTTVTCDDSIRPPPKTLPCAASIQAAILRLPSGHPAVVAIAFSYGSFCAPNVRCMLPGRDRGYVTFDFAAGRSSYVAVYADAPDGSIRADDPVAIP